MHLNRAKSPVLRGLVLLLPALALPVLAGTRPGPVPDAPAGLRPPAAPSVVASAVTRRRLPPSNATEARGVYTVASQGTGVFYRKGYVLRVGVNVIEADLSDPEVRIGAMLARGGIGTAEGFGHMVQRARPAAAITGTFFGMKNLLPTGDLVINGRSVFRGFIGTAVAITEGNVVSFIPTTYRSGGTDWSLFDTVIRGGPRLVDAGVVTMTARSEGFRTLPVSARRARTAVGLTRDNHLQLVAVRTGITLWELAKVMGALGAYHAVALDGGTSTAMYFGGRTIAKPGRGLTNVLMIYHRRDRFEAMRHQFAAGYDLASRHASRIPRRPTAGPPPLDRNTGFEPSLGLDFPVREETAKRME